MARRKLNELHKRFIFQQVVEFNNSSDAISKMLNDAAVAEQHGFNPVEITRQRVFYIMKELDPEQIGRERAKYLADFSDTPLAHKKQRVKELVTIYQELADVKTRGVLMARVAVLANIKAEIGEDIDKLAEALGRSGSSYHFNIGEIKDADGIRSNLAAILGTNNKSKRFIVSDN